MLDHLFERIFFKRYTSYTYRSSKYN